MRSFLSSLPNADLPDVAAEADLSPVPTRAPDDDDFIRPAEEDELLHIAGQSHAAGRPTALAKYLIWTFGPDHPALPYPLQLRTEIEDDALITLRRRGGLAAPRPGEATRDREPKRRPRPHRAFEPALSHRAAGRARVRARAPRWPRSPTACAALAHGVSGA